MKTMQPTQQEIEAFEGLNQSYMDMEDKQNKIAPRCHFKQMFLEHGDGENYNENWWECSTCGHTKPVTQK